MKIEVFVSPGCSHREPTLAAVNAAITEAGADVAPEIVNVGDYEDAKARRSFGSPTVRVDGIDIEYGDREPEEFSAGCRFYNSPDGWQPLPRKELVRRGIDAATARAARTKAQP